MSIKTVVILGMHRSGTSMVGGVLTRLGVDMGQDFPGKQDSNPLGHFEDGDFLRLNRKILRRAGGYWYDPPSPGEINAQGEFFAEEIKELLDLRTGNQKEGIWGWKDPRTSLTIELFQRGLDNLHILWCQREAGDVAASLKKRDQFATEKGIELTGVYNQRIAEFLEKNKELPVLVLPYQEIIADPHHWIEKICQFLDIHPSREEIDEAASFVMPPARIQRERTWLRWRRRLSLPYRAVRKIWRILFHNQRIT